MIRTFLAATIAASFLALTPALANEAARHAAPHAAYRVHHLRHWHPPVKHPHYHHWVKPRHPKPHK
jgi:hypothetical protein